MLLLHDSELDQVFQVSRKDSLLSPPFNNSSVTLDVIGVCRKGLGGGSCLTFTQTAAEPKEKLQNPKRL